MRYLSTRGRALPETIGPALAAGLAPDGGLFVPEALPLFRADAFGGREPFATPAAGLLGVFMGNLLIGMGWCFGVIAASSLIVEQFPVQQRVSVQGVGDLAMVGSGALAGVSSGLLFELFGYGGVNTGNAIFGTMLIVATAATFFAVRRHPLPVVTTG